MFKAKNAPANNSKAPEKAAGYLNLVLKGSDGKEHKFRYGIPLHETNLLERSVLNKHLSADDVTFELTGTVNIAVDVDNAEDIAL